MSTPNVVATPGTSRITPNLRVDAQHGASGERTFDQFFDDSVAERPDSDVRSEAERRRTEERQKAQEQAEEQALREQASASQQALLALGAKAARVRADGVGAQLAGAAGVDLAGANLTRLATRGEETQHARVLRGEGEAEGKESSVDRLRDLQRRDRRGGGGDARREGDGRGGAVREVPAPAGAPESATARPSGRGAGNQALSEDSGAASGDTGGGHAGAVGTGGVAGAAVGPVRSDAIAGIPAIAAGSVGSAGGPGGSVSAGSASGIGAVGSTTGLAATVRDRAGVSRGASTTPQRGTDRTNVYAQVERGLAQLLKNEGGTTTLRLTPQSLGAVRVELTLSNGEASATLHASTDVARGLLEASMDELRSALEARGVRVARLEVAPVVQQTGAEAPRAAAEQPREGSQQSAGGDPHAGLEDRPGEHGGGEHRSGGDRPSGQGGTLRHTARGGASNTHDRAETPGGRDGSLAEPTGERAERGMWIGLDAVA